MTILELYFYIHAEENVEIRRGLSILYQGKAKHIPTPLFSELVKCFYSAERRDGCVTVIKVE